MQTLCLVNANRRAAGLGELLLDLALQAAAEQHSVDMAATGQLFHHGPGGFFDDRARAAGYDGSPMSELLCGGCPTAQFLVQAWMDDEPHRVLLLAPAADEIGVGFFNGFSTAILGRAPAAAVAAPPTLALLLLALALTLMRLRPCA